MLEFSGGGGLGEGAPPGGGGSDALREIARSMGHLGARKADTARLGCYECMLYGCAGRAKPSRRPDAVVVAFEEQEVDLESHPVRVPGLPGRAFHKYEVLFPPQLMFNGRA